MTNDDERQRLATILSERALFRESVVLSSGRRSDYYVDVRQVLLDPEGAYLSGRMAYPMLQPSNPAAVGGLTLGADPLVCAIQAAAFLDGTRWNGFYVRKEAKKHGLQHWIEGPFVEEGTPVAVVDDVLTSGGSMLTAIERARAAGAKVVSALVVIDREEDDGRAKVEAELGDVPLHALFTAKELLAL